MTSSSVHTGNDDDVRDIADASCLSVPKVLMPDECMFQGC